MVGSEEDGPDLWCRAESLPEAGGRCNCWPATEDRVTRNRFWPAAAAMWWDVKFFFFLPLSSSSLFWQLQTSSQERENR